MLGQQRPSQLTRATRKEALLWPRYFPLQGNECGGPETKEEVVGVWGGGGGCFSFSAEF